MLDPTGNSDTKILHLDFRDCVAASGLQAPSREECLGKEFVTKKGEPVDAFNISQVEYNYNLSSGINVLFLNWTKPTKFKVSALTDI